MSHLLFEGKVHHTRFHPRKHAFTYPFYLLDIHVQSIHTLKNRLFSLEGFNLFSFKSKDHFGSKSTFSENVEELLENFSIPAAQEMRFLTLPRMFNFVFNPLSVLVLITDNKPTHMLAEVHNYNGGNIVYPVVLEEDAKGAFHGKIDKDMYVSPFFDPTGEYQFMLDYSAEHISLSIVLLKAEQKMLMASFQAKAVHYSTRALLKVLGQHTFLTFGVVTRTLWQSLKLYLRGLAWHSPREIDQTRRY